MDYSYVFLIQCHSISAAYFVKLKKSEIFKFISRLGLTSVKFICDNDRIKDMQKS